MYDAHNTSGVPADTGAGGWNDQTSGGTSYMSKIDLWSNYNGTYKETNS